MSERTNEERESPRRLIAAGTDIVGAGAGASIGYLLGGPTGAAAGSAYGVITRIMLQDVALDFTYRMLGEREEARVGAAVFYFEQKYREKLDSGEQPRQDGVFDDTPDDRVAAKELFEATLLAAQREHQEKKLRFIGNLMASIAFARDVDRAQANHLTKVAESLSYRQLCVLTLVQNRDDMGLQLRSSDYNEGGIVSFEQNALLQEIYEMSFTNLLQDSRGDALLAMPWINPSALKLVGLGGTPYKLMHLQ